MVATKRTTPNFEQALTELERLVERMETGELSLEESLKTFERGVELSRTCQRALDAAEQRIQILTEQNGRFEEKPFQTDDD
jgi:exodeoxyribonuclease VII small subunit